MPDHATQKRIAGALFDFLGHLTTMPKPLTVGSSQLAPPALDELQKWADKRGLSLDDADVLNWKLQPPEWPQ